MGTAHTTQDYILNKFGLEFTDQTRMPIEIPDFGRDQMATVLAELGAKEIVEVGVCDGAYSKVLCEANPEATIYGVDPFVPHKGYRDYTRRSTIDAYHQKAFNTLAPYSNYQFIELFSMDAVKKFEDESLDAVYIDANHDFQNTTNDIVEWSKKLKPGGILYGHDYVKHKGPSLIHVYQVVNAFTDSYRIRPWFLLGTNAIMPGQIRDKSRSWMWVKE